MGIYELIEPYSHYVILFLIALLALSFVTIIVAYNTTQINQSQMEGIQQDLMMVSDRMMDLRNEKNRLLDNMSRMESRINTLQSTISHPAAFIRNTELNETDEGYRIETTLYNFGKDRADNLQVICGTSEPNTETFTMSYQFNVTKLPPKSLRTVNRQIETTLTDQKPQIACYIDSCDTPCEALGRSIPSIDSKIRELVQINSTSLTPNS